MSEIDNGGSAFPHDEVINSSLIYEGESGMTLRDYFAAKAMCEAWRSSDSLKEIAEIAYKAADAMLKARVAA